MLKKLILHFWSLRREFAKYFVIGISAFLADVGSLFVLKQYLHLSPTLSVVVNQPVLIIGVFYANKKWSFNASGLTHLQMIRFLTLAGCNYVISVGWMHLMHDRLSLNYLLARTANIALAVAWNFFLYKYWVYRVKNLEAGI